MNEVLLAGGTGEQLLRIDRKSAQTLGSDRNKINFLYAKKVNNQNGFYDCGSVFDRGAPERVAGARLLNVSWNTHQPSWKNVVTIL